MVDQLITFETAELAKEKGFDEESLYFYEGDDTGNSYKDLYRTDRAPGVNCGEKSKNSLNRFNCAAPTQSLLQKWLREKHGIFLIISLDITNSWIWEIRSGYPEASYNKETIYSGNSYQRYEEALENALQKALTLIKNIK